MLGHFDIVIDRFLPCSRSIVGRLYANGKYICYTLELAWLWNTNNISCVPRGQYRGFIRHDKRDGWRIQLSGIPGPRTGVQIHVGNYPRDIEGCVLVGTSYGPDYVSNSVAAYELLQTTYNSSPGKVVSVKFQGVLATPWGDYLGKSVSSKFS
jgi:hypothetical protein